MVRITSQTPLILGFHHYKADSYAEEREVRALITNYDPLAGANRPRGAAGKGYDVVNGIHRLDPVGRGLPIMVNYHQDVVEIAPIFNVPRLKAEGFILLGLLLSSVRVLKRACFPHDAEVAGVRRAR